MNESESEISGRTQFAGLALIGFRATFLLLGIVFGALMIGAFPVLPIVLFFVWMAAAKSEGKTQQAIHYFMLGSTSLMIALFLALILAANREGVH